MLIIKDPDGRYFCRCEDCRNNPAGILPLDCCGREDFRPDHSGESCNIDSNTCLFRFIHHIKDNKERQPVFCELEEEIEIPFKMGRIKNSNQRICL